MKLYFSPGACSLAPHIVLRELDLPFELVRVDIKHDKTTADGQDFLAVTPKGYVPALALDDGSVLTEVAALLQYIADLRPQLALAPACGSMERVRLQEWLNFIATELHKGFAPLFNKQASEDWRAAASEQLRKRLSFVADQLGDKPYLMGSRMGVADAYLFVMLLWCKPVNIDLSRWPVLADYKLRMQDRPSVRAAMQAEGLGRR